MKVSTLFQEYIWLVETIHRAGKITLEDINHKWLRTMMSEGVTITRATFIRHKAAIEEMFGIIINCDAHDDYKYYIDNAEELSGNSIQNWMLSVISVNNLITESKGVHDRILLESVPSNGPELGIFIEAMKSGRRIRVQYCRYGTDEVSDRIVDPCCIKLFNRRWYGLVKHLQRETLFVIAFDRIKDIELTDQSFEIDQDFDAYNYFAESYGRKGHNKKNRLRCGSDFFTRGNSLITE